MTPLAELLVSATLAVSDCPDEEGGMDAEVTVLESARLTAGWRT